MDAMRERRAEQMRELLRTARAENRRIVSEALTGASLAAAGRRRGKKRKAPPPAPVVPSPFPIDEASAILRHALDRAAAVELRWQMMRQEA
jgi:hypothetical protein